MASPEAASQTRSVDGVELSAQSALSQREKTPLPAESYEISTRSRMSRCGIRLVVKSTRLESAETAAKTDCTTTRADAVTWTQKFSNSKLLCPRFHGLLPPVTTSEVCV